MKTGKARRDMALRRLPGIPGGLLPALAVVGGLTAGTATAIELGPLEVHSKLGHPLRASIAYVLAPNETVTSNCVSLTGGGSGFPAVFDARISIANGVISLSGRNPVNEPVMTANLVIDCPYTPHVSRSYTVFVNPSVEPAAINAAVPAAQARPEPRRTVSRPPVSAPSDPIAQDSAYRVQAGDSLSGIAERLQGRKMALQPAMAAIFDANPDAFIDGDPDQLQAGAQLRIPALAAVTADRTPDSSSTESSPYTDTPGVEDTGVAEEASLYAGAESHQSGESEPAASEPEATPAEELLGANDAMPAETVVDSPVENRELPAATSVETGLTAGDTDADYAALQPGDVIVGENLVADSAADAASIPDTTIAPPPRQIAGSRIIAAPPPQESLFSNWLVWLAAGVLAVAGLFLAFGQKLRERFGSTPVGPSDVEARPQSVHGTPRVAAISVPEPTMSVEEIQPSYDAVDFDLSDDSPTEENLALDADLIDGTGFEESNDVDVNRDFGFASTTSLDMELPDLPEQPEDMPETDIIPPLQRTRDDLIIHSEVLPDDDEYDMSVIVDVTKMPNPEDVTERDLMAVPVDEIGEDPAGDTYTISDQLGIGDEIDGSGEIDLDPMGTELDDEFAATQALSDEIEKAAAELVSGSDDSGATSIEMQLTSLSELDLTSELEAQNDDYDDDMTARIDADDATVEMPKKDKNAG